MFFEIGHQNWGKSAQGAALGTDGKEVKVRYSYVDWVVPQTDVKVRMGLQKYTLPNFTGIGSPILDADGAGITISNQFTENVGTNLFWLRAANDNDPEMTKHDAHDALDFIGLTVPLTFDGVKVTPWGMGGIIGQDSFKGSGPDMTGIAMPGMLPLGGDAAIAASSDKDHGSIWYGGIAADVTYFEPFRFALDAAYGSVDMGTSKYKDKNFDVKRSGWYAAFLAEYKLESCTPGLLFWYSSGDDANPYNGSERLPSIDPDVYVTSYGFDGTNYGGAAQTLGYGISGTWAVMARVKDISFMEDLSHVLRVVYYQGTNNKEMVRSKMISNPQDSVASMMYLTTGDKAVEVNFDTEYKLYKNLSCSWNSATSASIWIRICGRAWATKRRKTTSRAPSASATSSRKAGNPGFLEGGRAARTSWQADIRLCSPIGRVPGREARPEAAPLSGGFPPETVWMCLKRL